VNNVSISPEAKIGAGTIIHMGTMIEGACVIGENCTIGPNTHLIDSIVDDGAHIWHSVAQNARIGKNTTIGPFAYLRPGADIGESCKIGNFVEIKNTSFGNRSKASHLSYIGDSNIGEDVNIGCGVITVNFDGKCKHLTIVGDGAFVGCNANLVAPVAIAENTYIAAGSTITSNVPEGALAIARCRQTNKEGWVDKNLSR